MFGNPEPIGRAKTFRIPIAFCRNYGIALAECSPPAVLDYQQGTKRDTRLTWL
jgi:hypothetical protein